MKSERRHELETNVLADRLGAGIESTQGYLPFILGGIAIVAIGALGWGLYNSHAEKTAAEAWTDYYFDLATGDADSFLEIAEKYNDSTAAAWARATAGSSFLERGLESLYVNKDEGERLINQAIEQFELLENHPRAELRTKALLGLAQAHESLGDLDSANSYYERVVQLATQPRLLSKATERIAFLNSQSGKEFYAWFEELDPQPAAPIQLPPNLSLPPISPDGLDFSSSLDNAATGTSPPDESDPNALQLDPSVLPELPDLPGPALDPAELPGFDPIPPATPTGPTGTQPGAIEPPDDAIPTSEAAPLDAVPTSEAAPAPSLSTDGSAAQP